MKKIILLIFVVLLSVVVGANRTNDIIIWNVVSNSPSRTNDIIIFNPESVGVAVDSCTYTSGDFNITCDDNCTVDVATDVGGNNVSISGTGTINITVNITNYDEFHIQGDNSTDRCEVHFR